MKVDIMPVEAVKLNVIVFGTGAVFQTLKNFLYATYNVVAFADNDAEKQGTLLDGIEVINPDDILSKQFDKVFVTVTGSQKVVVKQLINEGVNSNDIVLGVNFLLADNQRHGSKYEYYVDQDLDVAFRYSTAKSANVLIENDDFNLIISSKDAIILPSIISRGGFSNEELSVFFSLSKEYFGDTKGVFLDVGANVGTTSLPATKNTRVSEVIAIEPSSDNFSLLQCNVFLNKLQGKIQAVNAAVSNKKGFSDLVVSPISPGDNRVRSGSPEDAKVEKIVTITIDSLIKDRDANEIAFMWVDVQGYEYYVLSGAKDLISTNKKLAVQIEFWPFGLRETNSLDLLCQFCKENFSKYIDMKEYLAGGRTVYDINSIDLLSINYQKNTYTDLFLIP